MPREALIVSTLLLAISPLTESQRIAMETAFDGRDHREEAFFALLENVESWTVSDETLAAISSQEVAAMIASPDSHRGQVCSIVGRLEQKTRLEAPYDRAWECFVRIAEGEPVLAYVSDPLYRWQAEAGETVHLSGRFYKRVDDTARDGTQHSYAAFVVAPIDLQVKSHLAAALPWMAAWTLGLLVMALILRRRVRRIRAAAQSDLNPSPGGCGQVDETAGLPDDPADALAELNRRAGRG